jgi:hypothetical protein
MQVHSREWSIPNSTLYVYPANKKKKKKKSNFIAVKNCCSNQDKFITKNTIGMPQLILLKSFHSQPSCRENVPNTLFLSSRFFKSLGYREPKKVENHWLNVT